jgi:hypothetical protein
MNQATTEIDEMTTTTPADEPAEAAEGAGKAEEEDAAETGQKQASSRAKPKKYGRGFIYSSLRDADEQLRKIDHLAKRMSKDGFARALGHKKAEGRFYNKLDALKSYKLVEVDGDDVVLTPLAIDMLYGGSEAARTRARTTAFLSYEDFSKTFAECPKGQDHPIDYVLEFVKGKLGIVNEVDRFKRLFLESAHFSGLLEVEGELNLNAKSIRFRHATPQSTTSDGAVQPSDRKTDVAYEVVGGDTALEMLTTFGLSDYAGRAEVAQRVSGKVSQSFDNGQLTLEVNRPVRIVIRDADLLIDLPDIVKAMRD